MYERMNGWMNEWINSREELDPKLVSGAVPGLTRGQARQGCGSREMNEWMKEWMNLIVNDKYIIDIS